MALFGMACSFLLILPFNSGQLADTLAPIRVSSQEAADHLLTKTLMPEYPPEAKEKRIEGIVRLQVVIDENGNVVDARAVSGNPVLIAPAITLVKRFVYRTFTRNRKRVSVTTVVYVPFDLHPR